MNAPPYACAPAFCAAESGFAHKTIRVPFTSTRLLEVVTVMPMSGRRCFSVPLPMGWAGAEKTEHRRRGSCQDARHV
jgi:hypothetical protein